MVLVAHLDHHRALRCGFPEVVLGSSKEPDDLAAIARSILERRSKIVETGVRGTPSVMINGRFVASDSKSRICLNELIAAEVNKG